MLLQEIILNIVCSGFASIIFFYVYKKSRLTVMLMAGMLTYIELLARVFPYQPDTVLPGVGLLIIPELIIILYMIWYTWKDGFKYIPIMIIILLSTFFVLLSIGHTFYGDTGLIFGLICIIWVNQSCQPCNINPFECNKNGSDRCNKHEGRTIDDWRRG